MNDETRLDPALGESQTLREPYTICVKCSRLLPLKATVCIHCGTYQLRRRPEADVLRITLTNLVSAVRACETIDMHSCDTPALDAAMLQAELALRPTTKPPPHLILEPKSAFDDGFTDGTPIVLPKGQGVCTPLDHAALLSSIHPDNPPLTCVQLLEHARDSADAMLAELEAANKLASGMASLLLLDMIRETGVMAARIRAIINATEESDANDTYPV